jgi:hypothetical protein
MRGRLTRRADGTLQATLRDRWGYEFELIGTRATDGYDVEVRMVVVPDALKVPGVDDGQP